MNLEIGSRVKIKSEYITHTNYFYSNEEGVVEEIGETGRNLSGVMQIKVTFPRSNVLSFLTKSNALYFSERELEVLNKANFP